MSERAPFPVAGTGRERRTVIVGAGFGGIGMAVRLLQSGEQDFIVLERADRLGGTWRDNVYPGCRCDVPSHLYSYSFAPNPSWTSTYADQEEIWTYLQETAERFGVLPHIAFSHRVLNASWDDASGWTVRTDRGDYRCRFLITASGSLAEPKTPDIEGSSSFAGRVVHSARWDPAFRFEGQRVAVIGTGASAIQIVPRIQPQVQKLSVFQRTPAWVLPHRDRSISELERALYRALPAAQRVARVIDYARQELLVPFLMHPRLGSIPQRIALRNLRNQVPDPTLRAKLTPPYRFGCKRILLSSEYLPALQEPNAELVTDPIRAITEKGVLTADGREHELDTIIFATGFHVTDMPLGDWLHARDGRTLQEHWRGSPQAYLGTTVAGCPNLFVLVGPNTGLGHNSIVFMIESQLRYVMDCIGYMERTGAATFEVHEQAQRDFNAQIQRQLGGSVWNTGGCASWYIDVNGKNTVIWPGSTWPYRRRLHRFDPEHYELRPRVPVSSPEAAHAVAPAVTR